MAGLGFPFSSMNGVVCEDFYKLLWHNSRQDSNPSRPAIYIPDTLIIRNNVITQWYFTSVQTGQIMRKRKNHLSPECVLEHFSAEREVTESGPNQIIARAVDLKSEDLSIEFLDIRGLQSFLFGSRTQTSCLLQIFHQPSHAFSKGKNHMIRLMWNKNMFVAEMRYNNWRCTNTNIALDDRGHTMEGSYSCSEPGYIKSSSINDRLRSLCQALSNYVERASSNKFVVNRMVIYTQIDRKDRPCILWTSQLLLVSQHSQLTREVSSPIRTDSPSAKHRTGKKKVPSLAVKCVSCGTEYSSRKHLVTMSVGQVLVFANGLQPIVPPSDSSGATVSDDEELPNITDMIQFFQNNKSISGELVRKRLSDGVFLRGKTKICRQCVWSLSNRESDEPEETLARSKSVNKKRASRSHDSLKPRELRSSEATEGLMRAQSSQGYVTVKKRGHRKKVCESDDIAPLQRRVKVLFDDLNTIIENRSKLTHALRNSRGRQHWKDRRRSRPTRGEQDIHLPMI